MGREAAAVFRMLSWQAEGGLNRLELDMLVHSPDDIRVLPPGIPVGRGRSLSSGTNGSRYVWRGRRFSYVMV